VQAITAAWVLLQALPAEALTLNIPAGSEPVTLPDGATACAPLPAGWTADLSRRRIKPPARAERFGAAVPLTVAPAAGACGAARPSTISLVLTGPPPVIEPGSVTVYADEGRLELRGTGLDRAQVRWHSAELSGTETCLGVQSDKGKDTCVVPLRREALLDPFALRVRVAPAGAVWADDAQSHDLGGTRLLDGPMSAARIIVSRVLASGTVDLSSGQGRLPLARPDAVASVDCAPARCELVAGAIELQAVPGTASTVSVRMRLAPRVLLAREQGLVAATLESVNVLRCAMVFASGRPLRNVDDARVLLQLDRACGSDAERLRWTANREPAEVVRVEHLREGVFVLLRTGRVLHDRLTIGASRPDPDGSVVAVASLGTQELPSLHSTLTLPGLGGVEFIPTNRYARLIVSSVPGAGRFVPVSLPGAYSIEEREGLWWVRGENSSGGYTALRFGWRLWNVPEPLRDSNFGIVTESVQRAIREANVPMAVGSQLPAEKRVFELLCATARGKLESLEPGSAPHIAYSLRDSCRLVIHRNRIRPEDGEQRVDIDVSVTRVGGVERPEGKQSIQMVVRHAPRDDVIWLTGAKEQFDRMQVRVTQVVDETRYALASGGGRVKIPAAQWTVVTADARFRFYATAALPASLYRFSRDPQDLGTGVLTLDMGVVSRFTWLNADGREAPIGLEAGMMGMGLASQKDRQLAAVAGLGISVPLGNINQPTQAAVNIHAWAAYTLGTRTGRLTNELGQVTGTVQLNPWAFVFGPSITIGNVGTFL
jgi:hypothetical protein